MHENEDENEDATMTVVRLAEERDAAEIALIHRTSRTETMPYLPPSTRSHEQVTVWVRDVVMRQGPTWVAERGGRILGFAAVDGDLLAHLYLRPEVLRQGVGTLLLDEVKRHRPDGVSLYVFQQNTRARAFYQRHGFTVVATGDGSGNMEKLPDLTLRWSPEAVASPLQG
ncbi:GNAT family N-acetyltransferase [Kitasatospora camelliae]|uniref:GNAT family N-acetyltransferase n=1 Tax=Kitasatospora camelliae TaxID=3156397 RepID=A0AAU8JQ40_9ACTN